MKQHIQHSLQEAHTALTALLANPAGLASVEQAAQQSPWDEAVAGWRELSARLVAAFGLA